MAPPDDHDCPLSDLVQEQQRRIEQLLARAEKQAREIAQLKKALMGPKSERTKMPSVQDALGKEPVSAENRLARRRQNAQDKQQFEVMRVEHKVPDDQRSCPKCGHDKLTRSVHVASRAYLSTCPRGSSAWSMRKTCCVVAAATMSSARPDVVSHAIPPAEHHALS